MLIQVSEKRWLAEPEAVWRTQRSDTPCYKIVAGETPEERCGQDLGGRAHWEDNPESHDYILEPWWVARMPSGTLEWLSDEEYERLIEVVPAKKLPGRHIKTLGLGARQLNMLLRDGVTSVEELERFSKRELQATRGIGEEGVAEIWKVLGRHPNDKNGKKSDFLVGLGSGR